MTFRDQLADIVRMWPTLLVACATFGLVYWIAPQQVGILVYTVCKLSIAGYVGYWLDRWIFPDSRPSAPDPNRVADDPTAAEYRRAAIVFGALISAGLMT